MGATQSTPTRRLSKKDNLSKIRSEISKIRLSIQNGENVELCRSELTKYATVVQEIRNSSKKMQYHEQCKTILNDINQCIRMLEDKEAEDARESNLDLGAVESNSFISQDISKLLERKDKPSYDYRIHSLTQIQERINDLDNEIRTYVLQNDLKNLIIVEKKVNILYNDLEQIEPMHTTAQVAEKKRLAEQLIKFNRKINNEKRKSQLPLNFDYNDGGLYSKPSQINETGMLAVLKIEHNLSDMEVSAFTFEDIRVSDAYVRIEQKLKTYYTTLENVSVTSEDERRRVVNAKNLTKKILSSLKQRAIENELAIARDHKAIENIEKSIMDLRTQSEYLSGGKESANFVHLDQKIRSTWDQLNNFNPRYDLNVQYKEKIINQIQQLLKDMNKTCSKNNEMLEIEALLLSMRDSWSKLKTIPNIKDNKEVCQALEEVEISMRKFLHNERPDIMSFKKYSVSSEIMDQLVTEMTTPKMTPVAEVNVANMPTKQAPISTAYEGNPKTDQNSFVTAYEGNTRNDENKFVESIELGNSGEKVGFNMRNREPNKSVEATEIRNPNENAGYNVRNYEPNKSLIEIRNSNEPTGVNMRNREQKKLVEATETTTNAGYDINIKKHENYKSQETTTSNTKTGYEMNVRKNELHEPTPNMEHLYEVNLGHDIPKAPESTAIKIEPPKPLDSAEAIIKIQAIERDISGIRRSIRGFTGTTDSEMYDEIEDQLISRKSQLESLQTGNQFIRDAKKRTVKQLEDTSIALRNQAELNDIKKENILRSSVRHSQKINRRSLHSVSKMLENIMDVDSNVHNIEKQIQKFNGTSSDKEYEAIIKSLDESSKYLGTIDVRDYENLNTSKNEVLQHIEALQIEITTKASDNEMKTDDEIAKMKTVLQQVKQIKKKIDCFQGTHKNIQYAQLESDLLYNLEKIEAIKDVNGKIVKAKSQCKETIKKFLKILDERSIKPQMTLNEQTFETVHNTLLDIKTRMEVFSGTRQDEEYFHIVRDLHICNDDIKSLHEDGQNPDKKVMYLKYVQELFQYFEAKTNSLASNAVEQQNNEPDEMQAKIDESLAILQQFDQEANAISENINRFQGKKSDTEFCNLDDTLIALMIKVDKINTFKVPVIKERRKLVMQKLNKCSETLDKKCNTETHEALTSSDAEGVLQEIGDIMLELEVLNDAVRHFEGSRNDQHYTSLDEALIKLFLSLDGVKPMNDAVVKDRKMKAMKEIQRNMRLLEEKVSNTLGTGEIYASEETLV